VNTNIDVHVGDMWTCHVCGRLRSDSQIKVRKFIFIGDGRTDAQVIVNVRYCADSPKCFAGTPDVPFVQSALKAFAP
jgi:hypothetical protein